MCFFLREKYKNLKSICRTEYMVVFKGAYWISSNSSFIQYWTFIYCSSFSYRSFNFAIAKVVALNLFASIFVSGPLFMASFLYCSFYSFCSSYYCDSNSCRSFTFLKVIAKSKSTQIAIAFKSKKEQ